jgi:hypothetical protein
MHANPQLRPPLWRDRQVARGQGALNFDGATHGFHRALKLHQEPVAGGFDLATVEFWEQLPEQAPVFVQDFQRERLVALGHRRIAHDVREHYGREPALFCALGCHKSLRRRQRHADAFNRLARSVGETNRTLPVAGFVHHLKYRHVEPSP